MGSALLLSLLVLAPQVCGAETGASVRIPYLEAPPKLDGVLDDPAWQKAARIEGLRQFTPRVETPMTEATVVYLGHDSDNLYVAFDAKDSEPAKIRAQLNPRDQIFDDDWVSVILDTFGDQRRAYEFLSNPLGIQSDIFSLAGQEDEAPDYVWYSEGGIHEHGYAVEYKIPFKSLRFAKAPEQPWRLHVGRNIQRKNEKGSWPPYNSSKGSLFSQMADMKGLTGLEPGRRLDIIPEFTASNADPYEYQKDAFHVGPWNTRAGVNLMYGFTPNWTLNAAYNPDFSQVEADQPQIQVNQRFPLFYAEKRPFFMEGSDLFSTPMRVVHTRTIVDPEYGTKLTGKQGLFSAAFLSAHDRSQGGSDFNILRLNTDVGRESTVGLICSDRRMPYGQYNRVAGADAALRLKRLYTLKVQGVGSFTRKEDVGSINGPAYQVSLSRDSRDLEIAAAYTDIHPRFQADSGFFNRTDIRQTGTDVYYHFWPSSGPLTHWDPMAGYWRTYDHQGFLTDEDIYFGVGFDFPLQTGFTVNLFPSELERYNGVDFYKNTASLMAWSEPFSFLVANFFISAGEDIDYDAADPYLGNTIDGNLSVTLKPTSRLSLQQTYLKSRLDTKSGARVFDENIYRAKLTYQWTKEVSTRAIYQYSTLGHSGFTDFLVSYLLTPGTSFHAGYDASFERERGPLKRVRELFFLKLSWLIRV
ncbi:MAG: DUF5916 domain-containing protein [Elusimicrobiota bacterium]